MQVYGASLRDPASACLVMELVEGGNLHQRIYDRSRPWLTHLEILQVCLSIAVAAFGLRNAFTVEEVKLLVPLISARLTKSVLCWGLHSMAD